MEIFNADCLEKMKDLKDDSIDLVFCDLPYGQTSCKWDCKIDLELFWKQIMRIKKLHTPIFFTTTTKFGVELIQSAPKKCFFRYDLVWVKSASAGFLCAKKMPLRKHEMIYVFYEKLPFYDLSSHQHKFVKSGDKGQINGDIYCKADRVDGMKGQYNPPLPNSVVKGENKGCYGEKVSNSEAKYGQKCARQYDPPLPVSVVKEEIEEGQTLGDKGNECYGKFSYYNNGVKGYDPPLPNSVIKGENNTYNTEGRKTPITREPPNKYDPPLPTTIVKEEPGNNKEEAIDVENSAYGNLKIKQPITSGPRWDPPLPDSMLEIKSTRGKHSTEKPVALMEWILKYYSKEGDVVLDPTCGSGSTGVACKNMKRNFIGIEMDEEIFKMAQSRII